MLQASKSKTVSATQTNPTTTNERTSEGNHVQQSIPSDPSMSETEDSEEVFSPNFPACSARDCVIAEPKRATSTTMTPVPDSMELSSNHVTLDPQRLRKIIMTKSEMTLMVNMNLQKILMNW